VIRASPELENSFQHISFFKLTQETKWLKWQKYSINANVNFYYSYKAVKKQTAFHSINLKINHKVYPGRHTFGAKKISKFLLQIHPHYIIPHHAKWFWHHTKILFTLHCGHDDCEKLEFKDFQDLLPSDSKTFKTLFFHRFSRPWKNGEKIQQLSRTFGHRNTSANKCY